MGHGSRAPRTRRQTFTTALHAVKTCLAAAPYAGVHVETRHCIVRRRSGSRAAGRHARRRRDPHASSNGDRDFEKAGGNKADANHPVEKWVRTLGRSTEESPRTPAGDQAAVQAVHLWSTPTGFRKHTNARIAYPRTIRMGGHAGILVEAGALQNDFTYFFRKLTGLLTTSTKPAIRAAIEWNLGRVWEGQKQEEKAIAAYRAAMESAPDRRPEGR